MTAPLDLTTHCALCGKQHPEPRGVPFWERSWCGDEITTVSSARPDRTELICKCGEAREKEKADG